MKGLFFFLFFPSLSLLADPWHLSWEPKSPRQGEALMIRLEGVREAEVLSGAFSERPLHFFPLGSGIAALTGIDLEEKAGLRSFYIEISDASGKSKRLQGEVRVREGRFGVERLELPREKVELEARTLSRVRKEAAKMKAVLDEVTPEPLWQGGFLLPIEAKAPPSGFGLRRIINGKPRSPHTGADLKAAPGTPVRAANRGRVVLVDEHFFAGRLVVLDHGLGVHTMYFHLQKQLVREGEVVLKGQPIGTVGATGRVTGPHLHFGVRIQGARVDPLSLLGLPLGP